MGSKVKSAARLAALSALVLFAGCRLSEAAFELDLSGPRAIGLGGAGVALGGDAVAAVRNPALTALTDPQMGVGWSQNFGLPELARESVSLAGVVGHQPWGASGSAFGSDLYRESQVGISVARRFRSELAFGLSVQARWLQIQNLDQGRAVTFAAGVVAHPVPRLAIGAAWRNLNEPRVSGYRDRVPDQLVIGTAIDVGEDGVLVLDAIQERRFRTEYRMGAEAHVMRAMWIRVGARAEPVRPSAGFEIAIRRWHFLYALDLHPDLGASHELGLSVGLRK